MTRCFANGLTARTVEECEVVPFSDMEPLVLHVCIGHYSDKIHAWAYHEEGEYE